MAEAERKASTPQRISLPEAVALAAKHYGSAELAKKKLLQPGRRYYALNEDQARGNTISPIALLFECRTHEIDTP